MKQDAETPTRRPWNWAASALGVVAIILLASTALFRHEAGLPSSLELAVTDWLCPRQGRGPFDGVPRWHWAYNALTKSSFIANPIISGTQMQAELTRYEFCVDLQRTLRHLQADAAMGKRISGNLKRVASLVREFRTELEMLGVDSTDLDNAERQIIVPKPLKQRSPNFTDRDGRPVNALPPRGP